MKTSCNRIYNRYRALHDFCKSSSVYVDCLNLNDIVLKDADDNSFSISTDLVGITCKKLLLSSMWNVTLKVSNNSAIFEVQ